MEICKEFAKRVVEMKFALDECNITEKKSLYAQRANNIIHVLRMNIENSAHLTSVDNVDQRTVTLNLLHLTVSKTQHSYKCNSMTLYYLISNCSSNNHRPRNLISLLLPYQNLHNCQRKQQSRTRSTLTH